MATKRPWAIILCRFLNSPPDPALEQPIENFFRNIFSLNNKGMIAYWQDISFGEIDIIQSQVFGWIQINITRANAGIGSGISRTTLIDAAIAGAAANGIDVINSFYSQIAVITNRYTIDGISGVPNWSDPNDPIRPFFIDGSTDGRGKVSLSPPFQSNVLAHEMGHGFLLPHTRDINGNDYGSPYCIMSAEIFGGAYPCFNDSDFSFSGPGLCSPYTYQAGWLPQLKVIRIQSNGKKPTTTTCSLSALRRKGFTSQVAIIDFDIPQKLNYFIEYRRMDTEDGWDSGLSQDAIVIHQLRPDGFAYYAGKIGTSTIFNGPPFHDDTVTNPIDSTVISPEKIYIDSSFDLSVEVISVSDGDGTVKIRIAPAAAVRTLSVKEIAKEKLRIIPMLSIKNQILQSGSKSLRDSLVELLGR